MTLTAPAVKDWIAETFDLSEPRTLQERAQLLRMCADIQADLNLIRPALEASLAEDMEEDNVLVEGVGVLVRSKGGTYRKWEGRRIVPQIVDKVLQDATDPETGERWDTDHVAYRVAEELIDCGGLDNGSAPWRSTALKARGLRPTEYAEYIEGRLKVGFA